MPFRPSPRLIAGLLSAIMILAGTALFFSAVNRLATDPLTTSASAAVPEMGADQGSIPGDEPPMDLASALVAPLAALREVPTSTPAQPSTQMSTQPPTPVELSAPTPTPAPLTVTAAADLPAAFDPWKAGDMAKSEETGETGETGEPGELGEMAESQVWIDWDLEGGISIYDQVFAAARRFDTIDPAITFGEVAAAWTSGESGPVSVLSDTLPALTQLLGTAGPTVTGRATITDVVADAWASAEALVVVPFDELVPSLAVLSVDGQTPVENASHFDPAAYPLIAQVVLHARAGVNAEQVAELIQTIQAQTGSSNRDAAQLTVLAMTGVTAMTRQTAFQMDRFGDLWPAEVVGPELASADITHISNEVPFVADCQTNLDQENFNFCSKPGYLATLTASGVDIIGLTGNHQNDFGYDAARWSLAFYEENGLPVYGGGIDKTAAFAPFYLEKNGTRFAFLGANMYGPAFAWATDNRPGSAEYDLGILSATMRSIRERDLADVILVELQWQESYDVTPLGDQRDNFLALSRAGADIVTGVQSHVPQSFEFEDGRLIAYGLGNLYFDQMWTQATRDGLILKHTFYAGRHISTRILTTLLYEHGQPRWTTPDQRRTLLKRVFDASYWEQ